MSANDGRVRIDATWFTDVKAVTGVVRVVYQTGDVSYYIGTILHGEHASEEVDARYIADWGAKFPKEAGDVLFPHLTQRSPSRE